MSGSLPPIKQHFRKANGIVGAIPASNAQPRELRARAASVPPGAAAVAPEPVYIADDRDSQPYGRLEKVMKKAITRATATWGPGNTASSSPSVNAAFEALAEHIERFHIDDAAAGTDQLCAEWVQAALDGLKPNEIISEDLARVTAMALDQLLSLLVLREPSLRTITVAVRELVHRCVFTSTSGAVAVEASEGFPRLLRRRDALAEEDLRDEFRDRRTYFAACGALMTQNAALRKTESALRRAVEHHSKSTLFFQRQQRKLAMSKAFFAWAVQSRRDKELLLLRTAAIENGDRAKVLSEHLVATEHKCESVQRTMASRVELLEKDRYAMKKTYDSFQAIAERSRRELAVAREQLRHAEAQSAAAAAQQIAVHQQLAMRWRRAALNKRLTPADNAFEHFNRGRCEAVTLQEPGEAALLAWCATMCRPFADFERACFGNYSSKRIAASYVLLLHAMSPGEVPYADVALAMESGAHAQGESLTHHLLSMQISVPAVPTSQMHRRPREDHLMLLSSVFARFAGLGAVAALQPPLVAGDVQVWESVEGFGAAMKAAATDDPARDPMMEEQRAVRAQQVQQRWHAFGVKVMGALGREAIAAVRLLDDDTARDAEVLRGYATLDVRRVADAVAEPKSEVAAVVSDILLPSAAALRRVFVFYATGGTARHDANVAMSVEEFHLLCAESRLVAGKGGAGGLKPAQISSVFIEATGNAHQMLPAHFAEAVVRIAALLPPAEWSATAAGDGTAASASSPAAATTTGASAATALGREAVEERSLAEKVELVVTGRILRYANGVAIENFKAQLRGGPAGEALAEVKVLLRKVFRWYAGEDAGGDNALMSEKEFLRFCSEAKLVDQICTFDQLQQIFAKIPDALARSVDAASTAASRFNSSNAAGSDGGSGGAGVAPLDFEGFQEVMCALALFKLPSPFVAFHQKVRRFVTLYIESHAATLKKR